MTRIKVISTLLLLSLLLAPAFSGPQTQGNKIANSIAQAQDKSEKKSRSKRRRRRRRRAREKNSDSRESVSKPSASFDHTQFDQAIGEKNVLDAVILLDSSRSMQRTDPKRLRDQGAKLFMRFLSARDRVAILHFDEKATPLLNFSEVNPAFLEKIDASIDSIPLEGNFTDLWTPLVVASKLLDENGRPEAKKSIILLSDGQMDPHPNTGKKEELIEKLLSENLPSFKSKGYRVYTLALSPQADKKLLADMSRGTDGLHWYTPDVDSVHKIFSDLFLSLKTPQLVSIDGQGFEIDGSTNEATFYISRKDAQNDVRIVDPLGVTFSNANIPAGVKWFRGSLFDIITIPKPVPGKWTIQGLKEPEGFATLLSDLKLQAHWPKTNVQTGTTVSFFARLTENGSNIAETPGMRDVTFYNYKIVNSRNGSVLTQGSMKDNGLGPDATVDDSIYSAQVELISEGEYKLLVGVTGPTFSRQQHISFSVHTGLVQIEQIEASDFTNTPENFTIRLSQDGRKIKNAKVSLKVRKGEEGATKSLNLNSFSQDEGLYSITSDKVIKSFKLKEGMFQIYAELEGTKKKEKIQIQSNILNYGVGNVTGDESKEIEVTIDEDEEMPEVVEEESLTLLISSIAISLIWSVLGVGFGYHKSGAANLMKTRARKEFTRPEDLVETMTAMSKVLSEDRRELTAKELELFASIKDRIPPLGTQAEPKQDTPDSDSEEPSEQEPPQEESNEDDATDSETSATEE